MPRPLPTDYAPYFANYINLVNDEDVKQAFQNQDSLMQTFFASIPETKASYAYADGKWTVKQLLQHLIDAERIFSYRALWVARKAEAPLPGFDENIFAQLADGTNRTLKGLIDELITVRNATRLLFYSFKEEELQYKGISNTHPVTVNAIGFISIGHILHHKKNLEERYL